MRAIQHLTFKERKKKEKKREKWEKKEKGKREKDRTRKEIKIDKTVHNGQRWVLCYYLYLSLSSWSWIKSIYPMYKAAI